jgi:hypothetical protein
MRRVTSGVGTNRTCRLHCAMSALGGKTENIYSQRVFPGLTQRRHQRRPATMIILVRLSNKQERAMSIIIRVVILATFAYAGSIVAGVQFPDLPDPYQTAQK